MVGLELSEMLNAKAELGPVYAIDLDGVLCEEVYPRSYIEAKPLLENIKLINSLPGFKYIFTARYEEDRDETFKWLNVHGVKFDLLIMNKPPYTCLIDDRTLNPLRTDIKELL